jgi:hypothetical protein
MTGEDGDAHGDGIVLEENTIEIVLPRESELRIAVPVDEPAGAQLRLVEQRATASDAEINGVAMATDFRYALRAGASCAVYSWTGCVLHLRGSPALLRSGAYRATTSNYKSLVEYHSVVHARRESARKTAMEGDATSAPDEFLGPRLVICGGRATGKHTAAHTLANLAVRQPAGWAPTVVDLDPAHQSISLPGSLGAAMWEYAATVDEGLMHMAHVGFFTGSLSPVTQGDPLAATSQSTLSEAYLQAAQNALQVTRSRLEQQSHRVVGWSGAIAVVPHVSNAAEAVRLVATAVDVLNATHVLCVGSDALHSALLDRFEHQRTAASRQAATAVFTTAHQTTFVLDRLSASSGAVDVHATAIEAAARAARFAHHFKGDKELMELLPQRKTFTFSQIDVMRWVDVDGRPMAQRIAEGHYAELAEKRIAAVFRATDALHTARVLMFAHVDAVAPNSLALVMAGALPEEPPGSRYVVVVGNVVWLA